MSKKSAEVNSVDKKTDLPKDIKGIDSTDAEELHHSEIYDFSPAGIFTLDRDTTITEVNLSGAMMLGKERHILCGRRFSDFVFEDSKAVFSEYIKAAWENKERDNSIVCQMDIDSPIFVHIRAHVKETGEQCLIAVSDISALKKFEDNLIRNEEKFHILFDRSPIPYQSLDSDGCFIEVNQAWLQKLGYNRNDVIGHWFGNFIIPEQVELFRQRFPIFMDEGEINDAEFQMIHSDGSIILTSFDGKIGYYPDGSFRQTHCVWKDITAQRKAENALQKSEEKYRSFVQKFQGIAYLSYPNWIPIFFKGAIEKITGYTEEDFISGNPGWNQIIHPDDMKFIIERDAKKLLSVPGYSIQTEYRIIRKDGEERWLSDFVQNMTTDKGELLLSGILTDITEKKDSEKALKEIQENYRNLVENINEVIFIVNTSGEITFISPVIKTAYGFTPEEAIGHHFISFIHPDDTARISEEFKKRMNGDYDDNEFRIIAKDGKVHYVKSSNKPIINEGSLTGFNYILTDITEIKKAEDALRIANKKLNTLSSITRHDILNVIMVIRGYLDITEKLEDDPVIKDYILKEKDAINTIQHQIEFTRLYQNIGIHDPAWQKLDQIIEEVLDIIDTTGIDVKYNLEGFEIFADLLISNVIYNLIENSILHGEHVTAITISSSRRDNVLVVTYHDNGIGISEEDRNKLFLKGFGKNTGLGLFFSKEILSITGITILETGETGKGVNFEIIVPKENYRYADAT